MDSLKTAYSLAYYRLCLLAKSGIIGKIVSVDATCTGPIIGFLLVDFATSGSILGPAIGMFGFALALALPFTLFAMFPSWLKSAPRSGS
jgi:Thiol:disulfide interchange protein